MSRPTLPSKQSRVLCALTWALIAASAHAEPATSLLSAAGPGEGRHAFLVGARGMSTWQSNQLMLQAAHTYGFSSRGALLSELSLSPGFSSLGTSYGHQVLPEPGPWLLAVRGGVVLLATTPGTLALSLGAHGGVLLSHRFESLERPPTLTLGLRWTQYVSSWPRLPAVFGEARLALTWEMSLTGWLGLLAEAAVHLPAYGSGLEPRRPTATLGLTF